MISGCTRGQKLEIDLLLDADVGRAGRQAWLDHESIPVARRHQRDRRLSKREKGLGNRPIQHSHALSPLVPR